VEHLFIGGYLGDVPALFHIRSPSVIVNDRPRFAFGAGISTTLI
jgi:hypothetical protein